MKTPAILQLDRMSRAARIGWIVVMLVVMGPVHALALEHVVFRRGETERTVDGELVSETQDGGIMVLAADGALWRIEPKELVSRRTDKTPLEPLSADALAQKLLAELPEGFAVHKSAHYVVLYQTSREYAQWCNSLLERLHHAFTNYWTHRGFKLSKSRFPLVVIVFANRASYVEYAKAEVGDAAKSMLGHYNLDTNRIAMYDLTNGTGVRYTRSGFNLAAGTVATIIHEATHQIAYNCGLHARLSDCPVWFSEGIATFFETPDLTSQRGWRTVGQINTTRFARFQQYLARRPADSLTTLLSDDKRFHDTQQGLDAYAEAWTLTYFLLRRHPKEYVKYLEHLSRKKPLLWDTPEERIREFEAVFGDVKELDREFLQYLPRIR
ncbi:MAG: DUF1570 domain-containing protein [Pirellulales bacterium]|nr:DUF1570 domain-containing protein [Pirellulales bacterium]